MCAIEMSNGWKLFVVKSGSNPALRSNNAFLLPVERHVKSHPDAMEEANAYCMIRVEDPDDENACLLQCLDRPFLLQAFSCTDSDQDTEEAGQNLVRILNRVLELPEVRSQHHCPQRISRCGGAIPFHIGQQQLPSPCEVLDEDFSAQVILKWHPNMRGQFGDDNFNVTAAWRALFGQLWMDPDEGLDAMHRFMQGSFVFPEQH